MRFEVDALPPDEFARWLDRAGGAVVTTTTIRQPAGGLYGWLAAADHKRIALMSMAAGLVFFVVSGANALLVRLELARPGEQVLSRDTYNEAFTMHGAGMVYLFVTPGGAGASASTWSRCRWARRRSWPRGWCCSGSGSTSSAG